MVGITSYNEYGEGTQIEAAVPRSIDLDVLVPRGEALNGTIRAQLRLPSRYEDYEPHAADYYMRMTREFAGRLAAARLAEGGAANPRDEL